MTQAEKAQAEQWAKGIQTRLGDVLYVRLWAASISIVQQKWLHYEAPEAYLFFCGYLLGPPGVVDCYSLELGNPLPPRPAVAAETARMFYRAGIAARLETL